MTVKTCLGWIRLYEHFGNVGLVCRPSGISWPTLRKWWRRYQTPGLAGLEEESRRPLRQANRKVFPEQQALILDLRRSQQLGIKQLRNGLIRQHGLTLSLDTLHRVVVRHGEQHLQLASVPAKALRATAVRFQATACRWTPAKSRQGSISTPRLTIARDIKCLGSFLERVIDE